MKNDQSKLSGTKKRSNRWNLLLVGENGKVINVSRIKSLIIYLSIFSIASIMVVAGLYYVARQAEKKNDVLKKEVAVLNHKVSVLQDEKDLLTANLVIARVKLKKAVADNTTAPAEKNKINTEKKQVPPAEAATSVKKETADKTTIKATIPVPIEKEQNTAEVRIEKKQEKTVDKTKNTLPVSDQKEEKKAPSRTPPEKRKVSVSISEFSASHDSEKELITVSFMLRNPNTNGTKISGRTLVVLQSENNPDSDYLALPLVKLESGKPVGKVGRSFRISRFKRIVFKSRNNPPPFEYDQAVLYVFDASGKPIFEKTHPVSIQYRDEGDEKPEVSDSGTAGSEDPANDKIEPVKTDSEEKKAISIESNQEQSKVPEETEPKESFTSRY